MNESKSENFIVQFSNHTSSVIVNWKRDLECFGFMIRQYDKEQNRISLGNVVVHNVCYKLYFFVTSFRLIPA